MKSNSKLITGTVLMAFLISLPGCQSPSSLPKEVPSVGSFSVFSNEVSSSNNLEKAVSDLEGVDVASTGTQSEAEPEEKLDSAQSPAAVGDGQGIVGLTFLFGGMGIALLTYKLFGGKFYDAETETEEKLKEKESNPDVIEIKNVSESETSLPDLCEEKNHMNEIIEQASNDQGS